MFIRSEAVSEGMGGSTLIDHRPPRPDEGGTQEPGLKLYERRRQIYPKLVHGRLRTIKWAVLILALGVYYGLPWIRWERGAEAANQAVLADFEGERFYFFHLEIWPQEVYYITGLLILAALGLFAVTALFGRVWCGYACPQTVWTDLFIAVERLLEGDRNARMKLDRSGWSFNKIWRKTLKHLAWIVISFCTGGAWILYWHDAPTLASTFFTGEAAASAYVFSGLLTFTTYALAGTMREQVCTYMCPWPRIQAALIDKDTLNITYRSDRGDPRGPHKKGDSWEGRGDCVDCRQCVVACPMGVDIRKGLQLECIHCGLCIDACDDIMKKVGRPTGLIAYDTDENVVRRWLKKPAAPFRLLRPRIALYLVCIIITAGVMAWGLATRSSLDLNVLKDRSPPFVRLADGSIRNGYSVKVINKVGQHRELVVTTEDLPGGVIAVVGGEGEPAPSARLHVQPDGVDRFRILVTAPAKDGADMLFRIVVSDPATGDQQKNLVRFSAPGGPS